MLKQFLSLWKTGTDKPVISDQNKIKRMYVHKRWSVILSVVLGYGFFYICRLTISVAKKPMVDEGILDMMQLGIIGAAVLSLFFTLTVWKVKFLA